jgi:prophage regulatory protein
MSHKVIRISELASTKQKSGKLPVSHATIWRWVKEGRFPRPFKLGGNVTVWNLEEVDAFVLSSKVGLLGGIHE